MAVPATLCKVVLERPQLKKAATAQAIFVGSRADYLRMLAFTGKFRAERPLNLTRNLR